jgi:hypothetical protein
MIKNYTFNYNIYEAEACFKVDTEKFDVEMANATLEFFTWDYDKDADPIDEVMKKYALEAIRIATFNNYNLNGVIDEFMNNEGYASVDGSMGISLNVVSGYEFDEDALSMEVVSE